MKRIILDTNFLLIPSQFRVDIIGEIDRIVHSNYKLFVIDKTIDELQRIVKSNLNKVKFREFAKIGLLMIESYKIKKIDSKKKYVDDAIVDLADNDTIVATCDKELRQRLKKKKIKVIYLKKKQFLVLE